MKLSEVGERKVVELARRICKRPVWVRVGIGDDAAAIDLDGRRCLVVTTDMLVAKTHFPRRATAEQIGHKSVVTNLSDLAAMGAKPLALIFSVGLPRKLEFNFVRGIIESMDMTARKYGTYVIGGDLDESDDIVIAGSAFGLVNRQRLLTRAGARPGDAIAVTGEFGGAAVGLEILLKNIPSSGYRELIKAQLEPVARVKEGRLLARSDEVTSAIDVTDGLAANLWQIARESKIKLVIDRAKIPVNPLVRKFVIEHGLELDDFVLFGGEDFELLFTVKPAGWRKVQQALGRVGTKTTIIGHVARGKGVFIRNNGKTQVLPDRGYEHFR